MAPNSDNCRRASGTERKLADQRQGCSYACRAYTTKERVLVHGTVWRVNLRTSNHYSSGTSMMTEFLPRIVERANNMLCVAQERPTPSVSGNRNF